jgi:Holliday junction DNA helicase RuvA
MLHYLRGAITMVFEGGIVVETDGGVGYKVFVPDNTTLYSEKNKEEVLVYTSMIVREDDISLYGFADEESLEMFQKLRTVSGVGPKAALAVLSAMPLNEVQKSILFDDPATLTKANGVGKKTAQRIVLELKDKLGDVGDLSNLAEQVNVKNGKAEAIEALIGLGYSKSEAVSALAVIENDDLTTEEYIKQALKGISSS